MIPPTTITDTTRRTIDHIFRERNLLSRIRSIGTPIRTEDPDDHVQDTAVRVFARASRSPGYLSTSPQTVVIGLAIDIRREKLRRSARRVRRAQRNVRADPGAQELALESILAPAEGEPDRNAIRNEQIRIVTRAMNALPAELRWALRQHYWHGRSLQEISRDCGKGYAKAKSWLQRGRKALRRGIVGMAPQLRDDLHDDYRPRSRVRGKKGA